VVLTKRLVTMPLDPITLATITSAVTLLGEESVKGLGSEVGKSTWRLVRSLFGWKDDPPPADIPHQVATTLTASPELAQKVWELLKNNKDAGVASSIVGKIEGEKVIVIQTHIGDIHM